MAEIKCSVCKELIPEDSAFCLHCGTKVLREEVESSIACPGCQKSIPKNALFCPHCGYKNAPETVVPVRNLMQCPNCKRDITSTSEKCPYCGHPAKAIQIKVSDRLIRCPKCGRNIVNTSEECSYCGYMIKPETDIEKKRNKRQEILNSLRWLLYLPIVVFVGFFILKTSNTSSTKGGISNIITTDITSPSSLQPSEFNYEQARLDSLTNVRLGITKLDKRFDTLMIEEAKINLANIKKKFIYKEDEFNDIGWYSHRNHTIENTCCRKYLMAHVNSNGYIYLESQYFSEDWLFHTRIEVKVGNNIYRSEDIPTYSENNRTHSSTSIWENVSYTGGQDNGILKAIALSGTQPIKVRFIGSEYYSDLTLLNSDRQAIKDSYELSNLIKKVQGIE